MIIPQKEKHFNGQQIRTIFGGEENSKNFFQHNTKLVTTQAKKSKSNFAFNLRNNTPKNLVQTKTTHNTNGHVHSDLHTRTTSAVKKKQQKS